MEAMITQTRQQTKYTMGFSSHGSKKGNHSYNNNYGNEDDNAAIEKMRKEIEANQDSALSLCTEKVLLARQAYDLVSFFCFLIIAVSITIVCGVIGKENLMYTLYIRLMDKT